MYRIVLIYCLVLCSCSQEEKRIISEPDEDNEITKHIYHDSTGKVTTIFHANSDSIIGPIYTYQYHKSNNLKDITIYKDSFKVLLSDKIFNELGVLSEERTYWYSNGLSKNILNEYLNYNNGVFDCENSLCVNISPKLDTIENISELESCTICVDNYQLDSCYVFINQTNYVHPGFSDVGDDEYIFQDKYFSNHFDFQKFNIDNISGDFYLVFRLFCSDIENDKHLNYIINKRLTIAPSTK